MYTCTPNDFAGIDGLEVVAIPIPATGRYPLRGKKESTAKAVGIDPYFPHIALNRTTIRLKIEKMPHSRGNLVSIPRFLATILSDALA